MRRTAGRGGVRVSGTERTVGDAESSTVRGTLSEPSDPYAETEPEWADRPTSTRDVWRAARVRRKALRAEIRRFTQRSRRRRIFWISAVGAMVLVIGGSAIAAYSPLFAVEKISVVGATTLDASAVEAALADQVGTPLALVDTSEVKAALLAFPLIETYSLEARPPHDLTVRIVERTPVGVIRSAAGYTLVDAAGVALATTKDQPAGQPLLDIEGGPDSAAFDSAGLVVRSVPTDLRASLTGVSATTADDVTLTLSSGLVVVWGSSEDWPLKAEVLSRTLVKRPDAATIDVTSPRAVVVG
ncbi:FtsQ-type POTRA domain-containing protein [Microbacterium sp. ISL-103]|uniref:FtsQ-type POTRA domain-containing protein n=1 Tax=Microbacterium sp. ISL-103 TaxID=2819156 RepID=UPI002889054C|nr:FtsQ-type POTRA domain-containing protein [Microbacterium sp. ISL-103]